MRCIFAVVALMVGLGLGSDAQAMTMVPRDYPTNNNKQATQKELPSTVAVYQNRIVILATSPTSHEVKASESKVDPALVQKLTTNSGNPVTLPNLIRALQAEIKNNPKAALPVTLAAFSVAKKAGFSANSTVSIVIAAIQSLKSDKQEYLDDIAVLIGFAVAASAEDQYANVLRQLRNLVIFQSGAVNRADFAMSLDEALVEYQVVAAEYGDEEFLAALTSFLPTTEEGDLSQDTFDLDMAFFQIENGVYSPADGALLVSPFTGGASGTYMNPAPASNNTSPNPEEPNPTPTPTPGPTPTPTPVPPTPVPTPPTPVS